MKVLLTLLISGLCTLSVTAQDFHLSQFLSSPAMINPASAGLLHRLDDYRFSNHYKRQWAATGAAYRTMAVSYDQPLFRMHHRKSYLGWGFQLLNDRAGGGSLTETHAAALVSAHVKVNDESTVSFGARGARVSRRIDLTQLTWDSQYDGRGYDPSLPTNEAKTLMRAGYWDVSAGISWLKRDRDGNGFQVGASAWHITQPKRAFDGYTGENLEMLFNGFARAQILIGKAVHGNTLVPVVMVLNQGPFTEVTGGASLRHLINESSHYTRLRRHAAFEIGGMYRVGDAAILNFAYEKSRLRFGFSYDFNHSDLKIGSRLRGGPELSLTYTGQTGSGRAAKL